MNTSHIPQPFTTAIIYKFSLSYFPSENDPLLMESLTVSFAKVINHKCNGFNFRLFSPGSGLSASCRLQGKRL